MRALVPLTLLFMNTLSAELMPDVHCTFRATVVEAKSGNAPKVRVTRVTAAKNAAAGLDCGVKTGKIYAAAYKGAAPLKAGDVVNGSSVYNESADCLPDESGKRPASPPPVLRIDES